MATGSKFGTFWRGGGATLSCGPSLTKLLVSCTSRSRNRVLGFVSHNGDAHAVYSALLNLEEVPRVGLTLSVGPWWDGAEPSQRIWVHVDIWPEEDELYMGARDPKQSNFYPWGKGGIPLTPDQLKASSAAEEIWRVADFIVEADPAICSYLKGEAVSTEGREMCESVIPQL